MIKPHKKQNKEQNNILLDNKSMQKVMSTKLMKTVTYYFWVSWKSIKKMPEVLKEQYTS